jgi:type VI protein secretion system component Hcp
MSGKWTLKYGLAAMLVAVIVIAAVLVTNPLSFINPGQKSSAGSFLVMLTDPPTLPANANTTILDLTYSNITLHVAYPNGTTEWVPVTASGTVDLLKLVDMSQTIASTSIPNGTTVDKIQFTISSVDATVNGTTYAVTTLSNTLVIAIANSKVNQTFSGVLVDFSPTLVLIQATNASGDLVNYFVLVPSATAMIVTSLSRAQVKVGTIVELGQNDRERLVRVVESFSHNLTIASATLSVNGTGFTSLNVTLKNEGDINFTICGLTLHGDFTVTPEIQTTVAERTVLGTIPFKVNGTSLIPLLGADSAGMKTRAYTLMPGQSATFSFKGVLELQRVYVLRGPRRIATPMIVIPILVTPIVGANYTLRLMNEGFQAYNVTAT